MMENIEIIKLKATIAQMEEAIKLLKSRLTDLERTEPLPKNKAAERKRAAFEKYYNSL